ASADSASDAKPEVNDGTMNKPFGCARIQSIMVWAAGLIASVLTGTPGGSAPGPRTTPSSSTANTPPTCAPPSAPEVLAISPNSRLWSPAPATSTDASAAPLMPPSSVLCSVNHGGVTTGPLSPGSEGGTSGWGC